MSDQEITNAVQEMYAVLPEGARSTFNGDAEQAQHYYADFVEFVGRAVPTSRQKKAVLLDVGCGCGWSSFAFANNHFRVTGVDLNARAFEPPPLPDLTLLEASALSLPFEDEAFDAVAAYQCLEHIPAPEAALLEMLRVCKPNGVVCIVGPNCLSPYLPLRGIIRSLTRRQMLWKRTPSTPRHPYGDTVGENLISIPVTAARLGIKLLSRKATFTMRVPDTMPPFYSDNDACYLCNPTDLVKFFPEHGCKIIQAGRHGRLPFSYLFAGGTWIAARK